MKIALISTYAHPIALGMRYVSSSLKAAGHDVKILLMSSRRDTAKPDWSRAAVEALIEHLRDRDLIGLSLVTNTFHRACVLTQRIREAGLRAPIIWGGTHPTVAPDESLAIADAICVGEGEHALRELAARLEGGGDPLTVPSLSFRAGSAFGNSESVRAGRRSSRTWTAFLPGLGLVHAVGLRRAGRAAPGNPGALILRVETSRGCPFHCTFCNNTGLQILHQGCKVTMRSIENVLAERSPGVFRALGDRSWTTCFWCGEEELEEFTARYNEQIGLPLGWMLSQHCHRAAGRDAGPTANPVGQHGHRKRQPGYAENIYSA